MLRLMTASDQSQSDEALLPSCCLFFTASTDSMVSILSYLTMVNMCRLDIAATNTASRIMWLSVLRGMNHRAIDNHKHSHESIRWFVERGINPQYLEISDSMLERSDSVGSIASRINGSTFLGLNMSLLRNISLCRSKIGDEEVLLLAHGCPNLIEIGLDSCCDITDASMIAIG